MISNSQLRSEARTSLGNGKWGIAIGGFLIYFIDKYCLRIKNIDNLGYKLSLLIGLFQCVALIPGVSRSGSIITCMRFLGFRREFAVKYSNLLSIPTIIGATSFLIFEI